MQSLVSEISTTFCFVQTTKRIDIPFKYTKSIDPEGLCAFGFLVQVDSLEPYGDIGMSTLRMKRQDNTSLTAEDMAASSHEPGVTVVIPCLNERLTIAEAVMQAKAAFAHWPEGVEVVVADNGSTDGSAELAQAMGASVVPVLERGYGAALQAGFAAARAADIVYAD